MTWLVAEASRASYDGFAACLAGPALDAARHDVADGHRGRAIALVECVARTAPAASPSELVDAAVSDLAAWSSAAAPTSCVHVLGWLRASPLFAGQQAYSAAVADFYERFGLALPSAVNLDLSAPLFDAVVEALDATKQMQLATDATLSHALVHLGPRRSVLGAVARAASTRQLALYAEQPVPLADCPGPPTLGCAYVRPLRDLITWLVARR